MRSSSYNQWGFCQHSYTLNYCLNLPSESNKSSTHIGSVVHYVLESCAHAKLAKQNGNTTYLDENFGVQPVELDLDKICDLAYEKVKRDAFPSLTEEDRERARELMHIPLDWVNPIGKKLFSPSEREIVKAEQFFDLKLEKDWARYSYEIDGQTVEDFLSLRGTIDLIVKDGDGHEIIDWKTGAKKDWNRPLWDNEKTYKDLEKDFQLNFYHYIHHLLYPDVKNVAVTIFYLSAGGPETICFTESDLEKTEKMIKDRFNWIKNCQKPSLIKYDKWKKSKCSWCHYSNHDIDNNLVSDYSESSCKLIADEIQQIGLDRTTKLRRMKNQGYSGGGNKIEVKD